MFDFEKPQSKEEVGVALGVLEVEITSYFDSFGDGDFQAAQGEHWSPAGHLRHLAKSVRAVAGGLGQPKIALWFFGRGRGSRSFDEMVAAYRAELAAGGKAGRYGPSAAEPERSVVMARWSDANSQLQRALASWSERALDRYRLPHPLLGKLTVREMLFFTLYHNAHHARRVLERAESAQ